MFSATVMLGTQAFRSGSSGRLNARCADLVARGVVGLAVDADLPGRAVGRWPISASTSSRWPLPDTPAMPTISPASHVER